jgi:hypothetical protein
MTGIIGKLFLHNGRVPWIQFIIAFVVGIVSSLAYIKYKKPQALLSALCPPAVCPAPRRAQPETPAKSRPPAAGRGPSPNRNGGAAARYAHPGREEDIDLDLARHDEEGADEFVEDVAVFPLPIYVAEQMMQRGGKAPRAAPIQPIDEEDEEADLDAEDVDACGTHDQ